MDATATPRGISLAAGELGARGRQNNYYNSVQATAVRISSSVNGDMCGTCQGWLAFCPVCRRETPESHGSCFARPTETVVGALRPHVYLRHSATTCGLDLAHAPQLAYTHTLDCHRL